MWEFRMLSDLLTTLTLISATRAIFRSPAFDTFPNSTVGLFSSIHACLNRVYTSYSINPRWKSWNQLKFPKKSLRNDKYRDHRMLEPVMPEIWLPLTGIINAQAGSISLSLSLFLVVTQISRSIFDTPGTPDAFPMRFRCVSVDERSNNRVSVRVPWNARSRI